MSWSVCVLVQCAHVKLYIFENHSVEVHLTRVTCTVTLDDCTLV